jgi:hypothetical protein
MNPTDNEIQTKQEAGIEGLINFRDLGISTKDNEQQ